MNAKTISFTIMMGVLGNVLFVISYFTGNLAPGIGLDFSLLTVFIAGFYGGPLTGFITGLFVGIFPGIMFGPMGMGSWLGLFGLPIGKGLTGFTIGVISKYLKIKDKAHPSVLSVISTLAAYIPECLFTYAYFAYLMPFFLGSGGPSIFLLYILPKALSEVAVMSFLIAALIGNRGFNEFINRFFTKSYSVPKLNPRKILN